MPLGKLLLRFVIRCAQVVSASQQAFVQCVAVFPKQQVGVLYLQPLPIQNLKLFVEVEGLDNYLHGKSIGG